MRANEFTDDLSRVRSDRDGRLAELTRLDHAVYAAIASAPTPHLDATMRTLSQAANYSRLSVAASGAMAAVGQARGRRAAAVGLTAIAITSGVVNLLIKPLGRRRRPDRTAAAVPDTRRVPMPASRSFPSGHAAAAFAFASAAGSAWPAAGVPLYGLAGLVSYSRVHTGVHFPGDVVAGALIGMTVGDVTAAVLTREPWRPRTAARSRRRRRRRR